MAQLPGATVTKAQLDHEMTAIFGGDFFEITGHPAPTGLISQPPHYSTCATTIHNSFPTKGGTLSTTELTLKCRQLYEAITTQALEQLIEDKQILTLYTTKYHITATNQQITKELNKVKTRLFPQPAQLTQYLAEHHWTLADERLLIQFNILSAKMLRKIKTDPTHKLINQLAQQDKQIIHQTHCQPHYIVEFCAQYTTPNPPPPTPAILIEDIALT